jgi:hypothetical protein
MEARPPWFSLLLPVDEARAKLGWAGRTRPAARDMRDPECVRVCVYWPLFAPLLPAFCRLEEEVERFTELLRLADAGMGIADMFALTAPRVWIVSCCRLGEEWNYLAVRSVG